jgi:hypothetical protein
MDNRIAWPVVGLLSVGATFLVAQAPPRPIPSSAPVDQLIPWLLKEDQELRGIPFAEVIRDTTGKKVIPINPTDPADERVIKALSGALDELVARINQPDSAIQKIARINEVSSHFEDAVRERLNTVPGLHCDIPPTADGHVQRSGYPDLRLTDKESGRVYYLDPKLYAAGARDSSFRTFYFEPKVATNKVRDDAVHLILGFEHQPLQGSGSAGEPREKSGGWKFTRWDIVDLSGFRVKLKAEFQGSNRDMYRPEAIVATSAK